MPRNDKKLFSFQTDQQDRKMLQQLADAREQSQAAVLRDLIQEAWLKLQYLKSRVSGGT